jgi:electron transfer flavoprotein beta subunit
VKICVCLKEAVDTRLNSGYGQAPEALYQKGLSYRLDPPCEAALIEALQMKAADNTVEITLVGVGPRSLETYLRIGLAAGADRALRIWQADFENLSTFQKAKILGRAISLQKADLILTGAKSSDNGSGMAGPLIAAWLDISCICEASRLQLETNKTVVTINRKTGKGMREKVCAVLPALITLTASDKKLRYSDLRNLIESGQREISCLSLTDLGLSPEAIENDPTYITGYSFPRPRVKAAPYDSSLPAVDRIIALLRGGITQRRGKMLEGDTDEMVDQLFKLLTDKEGTRPAERNK